VSWFECLVSEIAVGESVSALSPTAESSAGAGARLGVKRGREVGMGAIRVLVVDDHPRVRRGLRSLLSTCRDIEVVGEAEDGAGALQAAVDLSPDVILLDIRLPGPDGVELAYQLRQRAPQAKVIILTAYDHDEYVSGALRAGVYAYLLKSTSDETLVEAVRSVHQGKRLLSPALMDRVLREFETLAKAEARHESGLSDQELRVLQLVARGLTTGEIGEEMYWSTRTVKRKIAEIKDQLGARSRAQAVAEAIRRGLI
jgi:DNA-binding NarL/FixJ family response regulator